MRKLRAFWPDEAIASIYRHVYDHTKWNEHVARVRHTTETAQRLIDDYDLHSVTDLSCGDGAIICGLTVDFVTKNDISYDGDGIEVTSLTMEPTDLFICSETIEHLQAPWTVLGQIAQKTKWLVLSTPLNEDIAIGNHEHYWSFAKRDVDDILRQAGFLPEVYVVLSSAGWTYDYQIWTARSQICSA